MSGLRRTRRQAAHKAPEACPHRPSAQRARDGPQHWQARRRMAWPERLRLATRPVARQNRSGFSSEVYRAVTVLYLGQVVDLCETREAALDDLRDALQALIAEVGIPDELTLTLNVA